MTRWAYSGVGFRNYFGTQLASDCSCCVITIVVNDYSLVAACEILPLDTADSFSNNDCFVIAGYVNTKAWLFIFLSLINCII